MQTEKWKAIGQAVQLGDADRAVLDKIQSHLGLSDTEFLTFLRVVGKVAPTTGLRTTHLPKP